ncbi:MAG: cytochrome c family protein, partial [Hyphomicrobiaceae bacterium]
MDSWEFNKIAGAVLAALLLAFGSGTLADIITGAGHGGGGSHGKPGYELPVTAAPSGAATPAAPKFNPADVVALLKGASPDSGKDIFRQCQSCHSSEKGDERKLQGPNLYGIVGRDRASHAGFNYSSALKTHPGKWT